MDAWLLRGCAVLGIKLTHSTPGRPQGRGKIERLFLTVREQFLVEITGDPGRGRAAARDQHRRAEPAVHRLGRNRLPPPGPLRNRAGPAAAVGGGLGRAAPPLPGPGQLHEAFLWSERRTVRKTATVSLHGNTYQVDPSLAGRKVELVFDPFDLASIEVRWQGNPAGQAIPHVIGRHAHPKARPEQPAPPAPATGIDYIGLIDAAHDTRLAGDAISFAGLTGPPGPDQLPGQMTIDEALPRQEEL